MKTRKLLAALLFGVSLAAASTVFAQVKIGTSPTTIDPNSNLEIQASTTGRKISVHKTSGQMTIADGTQGDNKVLTSDANGNASWKNPLSGSMVNGTAGTDVFIPTGTATPDNQQMAYSGAYIIFPKAGTYIVYARWLMTAPTTSFNNTGHGWINTELSDNSTTNSRAGTTAEWVFFTNNAQHSTAGFKVDVTAALVGQRMYFWYFTGHFSGTLKMLGTYAIGPF